MSRSRVAALVCEGQTDVPVLREMIYEVWPEVGDVRCLQPELDEMDRAKGPAGWSQVKTWCETHAGRLNELLEPDLGDPIDLLLVAVDLDIAIAAGIADPPRQVGRYETTRLRATMTGWLKARGQAKLPNVVILSSPVMAIEAWIIAALFPRESAPEDISDPAAWLVERNKLRLSPRDGKPWKELHLYRAFASKVAAKLTRVRKVCSEADRTMREVERRREDAEA
jgi:hypothetical protein